MMTDSGDVTIVIVSYNTRDLLVDCLRSIYEQTHDATFEVVVVDNASRDGSPDRVREIFPRVILIVNDVNRGFAAAANQGIRRARGRYVLLLNPDTIILDGAIDKAIRVADANGDAAVIGCQVLENETTVQKTCFRFPSVLNLLLAGTGLGRWFPRSRIWGRANMGRWDRRTARDVDVVSGMFFLVRRRAIEKVGPLDEDYFVFAEEADWCYRFHRAGWRCVFTPEARIIHRDGGSKSTNQVGVKMYVQLQKSLLLFLRKNRGKASFVFGKIIFVLAMAGRTCFWRLNKAISGQIDPHVKLRPIVAALRYHLTGKEP